MTLPGRIEHALPLRPDVAGTLAAVLSGAVVIGAVIARSPLLGTAALLTLALAATLLVRPDLATVIVVFLLFTNSVAVAVNYHGVPLPFGGLFPFLIVVPLANYLARGEKIIFTPTFVLILVLLVVQLLSTVFSSEQEIAFEKVKTFVYEGVILTFLITNVVRTPWMLRAVVWTALAAGAFLAAISVFQELTATFTRPYGGFGTVGREFLRGSVNEARLAGPFGDPNYYAQVLLIVVPLGLLSVWRERSLALRLLAGTATALVATAITFTLSRGAAIAFLVMLVALGFLRYLRASRIVAIVIGVLILAMAVPEYRDRVTTLTSLTGATAEAGSEEAADASARTRATEMLAAGLAFVDHPLIGVGPDVFPSVYQDYANRLDLEVHQDSLALERQGQLPEREAHNLFLGVAADLGALGLFTLLGILAITLRELRRARRRCLEVRPDLANIVTAFMLALIVYVTAGLFLTLAFERYFWLLLGLSAAAAATALRAVPAYEPRSSSEWKKNAIASS